MHRSLVRVLAVSAAAAGIAAGVASAAPSASAATQELTVTSGSVAITLPDSYVAQLAKAGVIEFPVPVSDLSASKANQTVTATFSATGGDAELSVFFGQVDLAGSIDIIASNGSTLTLNNLVLNIQAGYLEGTPAGSSTPVPLLDMRSNIASWTGQIPDSTFSQTLQSNDLEVDPTGAAYLNNALGTAAFQADEQVGTLSATWADSYTPN
jgi:hypothetical protein